MLTTNTFIEEEQVITVDVDDTLVLHKIPEAGDEYIDIIDPYDNASRRFVIHKPHLKLIADRQARGCKIIVWSQGGPLWAKAVVDALGINNVLVMAKPFMYVDDLPVQEWMGNRAYLSPKGLYGSNDTKTIEQKSLNSRLNIHTNGLSKIFVPTTVSTKETQDIINQVLDAPNSGILNGR